RQHRHDARGTRPGSQGPDRNSRHHGSRSSHGAHRNFHLRAASFHAHHSHGQDSRPHRPRREEHSRHYGIYRLQDRRERRRHGPYLRRQRESGGGGASPRSRNHRYGRNRQDLSRQSSAHRGIRRFRRDFSRHRRLASHQRNRGSTHSRGSRRTQRRRSGDGEGPCH